MEQTELEKIVLHISEVHKKLSDKLEHSPNPEAFDEPMGELGDIIVDLLRFGARNGLITPFNEEK